METENDPYSLRGKELIPVIGAWSYIHRIGREANGLEKDASGKFIARCLYHVVTGVPIAVGVILGLEKLFS